MADALSSDGDFGEQLERALRLTSDEAASAMLARGRSVSYRERDTPAGHVIREDPDGTKTLVRIELDPLPKA